MLRTNHQFLNLQADQFLTDSLPDVCRLLAWISENVADAGHLLRVEVGVAELAVCIVELAVETFGVLGVETEAGAIWRLLFWWFWEGVHGRCQPGRLKMG